MGSVIKSVQGAAARHFSFEDIERRAQARLAQARQEAAEIVTQARRAAADEHAQARQEAYESGRREGREAGLREIRQEATDKVTAELRGELQQVIKVLQAGVGQFNEHKWRLLAEAESGLIQLALAIARRVCKHLAEHDQAVAVENARHALLTVRGESDLELRVHPTEHAALENWAAQFVRDIEGLDHVHVVPDPQVDRGGCVVHGRRMEFDARLETQLDRVAAAICGAADQRETAAEDA